MAAIAFTFFVFSVCGVAALSWVAASALGLLAPSTHGTAAIVLAVGFTAGVIAVGLLLGAMRGVGIPMRSVMDAAERVADGDYSVRVPEHGAPPFRGLARAFNTMTERLGKNEQQRRNLMADVAHELRTPLTIIQGKLEGLLDGVYPREDEQLAEILDEASLLSRLIEDLRTLALSESGALRLEKEVTDVAELAQDVLRAFEATASARQVSLRLDVPKALPAAVIDGVRVRQVLNNLLSNALQHTPPGGTIEISVKESGLTFISVAVQDSGAGMTREDINRAFERFHKGPGSQGSGLGLTIARNLVLAHGGEIEARSEPGRGTIITFTLPYQGTTERLQYTK